MFYAYRKILIRLAYVIILNIVRFFNIFVLSHPMHFTVIVYCYVFYDVALLPFFVDPVCLAFTDNTSSVLKEKVLKHRDSYVIRHK